MMLCFEQNWSGIGCVRLPRVYMTTVKKKKMAEQNVTTVTKFSDNCTGQNSNRFIS